MKLRILSLGLLSVLALDGQKAQKKGFDFTEACFRNPSLPYCSMREFVVKPGKPSKFGSAGAGAVPDTPIDSSGIDWRFADPDSDAIAVLDGSKLSSPLAHSLIDRLAAQQGLTTQQAQDAFRALSGVKQVALSIRENSSLMVITGRPDGSILPALESGWKAVALGGDKLLLGETKAVEEASKRLAMNGDIGELPLAALYRTSGDVWLAGSAKLARPEAVSAGVKRFEQTASWDGRLTIDTVYEFADVPDAAPIKPWLDTLGNVAIDGPSVHSFTALSANEVTGNFAPFAASPLGRQLAAMVGLAHRLPVQDAAGTVHTRPVIIGLDGGPRETK